MVLGQLSAGLSSHQAPDSVRAIVAERQAWRTPRSGYVPASGRSAGGRIAAGRDRRYGERGAATAELDGGSRGLRRDCGGCGPAGSTAARVLATGGARVLLLDRAAFPRDKPCGGGVTIRAAELLPFDLAPVVERTVHGVHMSLNQGGGFTRRYPRPITYLTQRRHLDAYLVEQAVRGRRRRSTTARRCAQSSLPDGVRGVHQRAAATARRC